MCGRFIYFASDVMKVPPHIPIVIVKSKPAQLVTTMADMEGEEAFDPACLGECAVVSEDRVGDGELMYFRGTAQLYRRKITTDIGSWESGGLFIVIFV